MKNSNKLYKIVNTNNKIYTISIYLIPSTFSFFFNLTQFVALSTTKENLLSVE